VSTLENACDASATRHERSAIFPACFVSAVFGQKIFCFLIIQPAQRTLGQITSFGSGLGNGLNPNPKIYVGKIHVKNART
jgi:hypothetical protein